MFIIIMGVSGSGKTTIGKALAKSLGYSFYDGDDFHPPANVAKMAKGIPLTDEDRAGWLQEMAAVIAKGLVRGEDGVIACSALKEKYREVLRVDPRQVRLVYLKGSYETIKTRMKKRQGHFMNAALLQSQYETLEEPGDALVVDVSRTPEEIVQNILLNLS